MTDIRGGRPKKCLQQGIPTSPKMIITCNIPVWMIELINQLINAGLMPSRSEIVRQALLKYLKEFFNDYGEIIMNIEVEDMFCRDEPAVKSVQELKSIVRQALHDSKLKLHNGGVYPK